MKTNTYTLIDDDLVKGCIEKDNHSRKLLYNRYSNELYTTAYHIVNDKDLSNDILHDSFIQIFNDIKSLRNTAVLKFWMRKIVIHTSLKTLKKLRQVEYTDQPISDGIITWPDPMSGELLEKAMFNLPEGYRIVFSLIAIEGYKHQEVAKMLNISEGTSKSQLFHAKKHLRKMLSNGH
ncbi:MAG: hypothetical protein A2W85_07365 [Bacteroidetes bacterium GWF2_41_31]|nr:MAG: hypothetical protein A2W85_07365 [Bacteroidetes bacterium GWF2_41_31]